MPGRKGFALRLHQRRLTPAAVVDAVHVLLADDDARAKAAAFRDVRRAWDGPRRAADYLAATFLPRA